MIVKLTINKETHLTLFDLMDLVILEEKNYVAITSLQPLLLLLSLVNIYSQRSVLKHSQYFLPNSII